MRISTSRPAKTIIWSSLFSVCFYLLFFSPSTPIQPAFANDLPILCFAIVTEVGPGQVADSCADVHETFPNATVVRSTDEFPADLSPFEAVFIAGHPSINYSLLANQVNNYVSNGGGLILSFPSFENGVPQLPAGFELTITNQFWPGFPNEPGPVEFTATGLSHPILAGISSETLPGVFSTIPISSLGTSWSLLAKAANHPNAALAVGEHGSGRIAFFVTGTVMSENGTQFAEQLFEWVAGDSAPPPAGLDMQIDAIEVTQAIQDLKNSVDLIADKRTYVRVHVSATAEVDSVVANLTATRNGTTLSPTLIPANAQGAISIVADPDRGQLNDSFLFELPIEWTEAGTILLKAEIDPENEKLDPDRLNNTAGVQVEFIPAEPLNLVMFNVGYPTSSGIRVADGSHLDRIEEWLQRAYPISTLTTDRRATNSRLSGAPDVDSMLTMLILVRSILEVYEDIPANSYFYAVAETAEDSNTIGGVAAPWSGVAVGHVGDPRRFDDMAWDIDNTYGDWIAGHEIAHLLGRRHADCPDQELGDSVPFPYPFGKISEVEDGDSAFYGFEVGAEAIYEPNWFDLMSYCEPKWISDVTYEAIYDEMSAAGQRAPTLAPSVAADQFLIVTALVDLDQMTVQSLDLRQIKHSTTLPLPESGSWTLALLDSVGGELASYPFAPNELDSEVNSDEKMAIISETVPWQTGVASIEIRNGSTVVATQSASDNAPAVAITSPTEGQTLEKGELTFTWAASDADNDSLVYTLLYNNTGEGDWNVLTTDWITSSFTIDSSLIPGGSTSQLRVIASDGFLASEATVGPFTVPSSEPEPTIIAPDEDETFSVGQLITLQ
ncbi:MAG: hypothetical protein AB8G95_21890, partial [Anaerolineae bacterium]